jgi:hypothetical protein
VLGPVEWAGGRAGGCPVGGKLAVAMRVHIVGASGAGTTTLGRALARRLTCPHLDTDDYFWLPSQPPFQNIRPAVERRTLLGADLARHPGWVLSGSPVQRLLDAGSTEAHVETIMGGVR